MQHNLEIPWLCPCGPRLLKLPNGLCLAFHTDAIARKMGLSPIPIWQEGAPPVGLSVAVPCPN
jgi:hypothetical protein